MVNNIKHTVLHTAEPIVLEPIAFEVQLTIQNPKSHKSQCIDQIPALLIN
jgi:hypothetical protein